MALQKRPHPKTPVKNPKPLGDVKAWWHDLEKEGVIGMWADRKDIGGSSEFARKLRVEAQNRPLT